MNTSRIPLLLGMIVLGLAGRPALADCTPGETRCGADSLVETCTREHVWRTDPATACNRSVAEPQAQAQERRDGDRGRNELTSGKCTSGISRCGAGGQVERCTDANAWITEPGSFCGR